MASPSRFAPHRFSRSGTLRKRPRWNRGSEVIERLLEARQLQRVPADAATVEGLLESARRHVATGRTATTNDPEGSFSLAYDAAGRLAADKRIHSTTRNAMNASNKSRAGAPGVKRSRVCRGHIEHEPGE